MSHEEVLGSVTTSKVRELVSQGYTSPKTVYSHDGDGNPIREFWLVNPKTHESMLMQTIKNNWMASYVGSAFIAIVAAASMPKVQHVNAR